MAVPLFNKGFPKRETYCHDCQRNRHGGCILHMNDGAFDAEDFLNVRCKCPCEGEISGDELLIDLVARLREDVLAAGNAAQEVRQTLADTQRWAAEVVELCFQKLPGHLYDDEGLLTMDERTVNNHFFQLHELLKASPIESIRCTYTEGTPTE